MDKEAIKQIQESANIPELIDHLTNEKMGAKVPLVLLPESMKVSDLEKYMEFATHYKARFETAGINDFVDYCEQFTQDDSICAVNAESMAAKTIFDIGTPEKPLHRFHSAIVEMKKTAAFGGMLAIGAYRISQKAASEFLEDWSEYITVLGPNVDVMTTAQGAEGFRKITIDTIRQIKSEQGNMGESMSAMEKIEAANQDKIPHEIIFKCIPYTGLKERQFALKVSVLAGESKPEIILRIVQLESTLEEIAVEFKDRLKHEFSGLSIKTFIGKL